MPFILSIHTIRATSQYKLCNLFIFDSNGYNRGVDQLQLNQKHQLLFQDSAWSFSQIQLRKIVQGPTCIYTHILITLHLINYMSSLSIAKHVIIILSVMSSAPHFIHQQIHKLSSNHVASTALDYHQKLSHIIMFIVIFVLLFMSSSTCCPKISSCLCPHFSYPKLEI